MRRAISIVVVLAAASLAACSRNETAAKKEPAPTTAQPAATTRVSPELAALLPAKDEVPGWAVSKAARGFTAENLWELIDGAADSFVNYGVQDVVTAEYTQAGTGYQAVIEIYRMKDPLNAFGKYAEERNPDYKFLEVGNEGYSGGTSLNFWTGPYYVKLTAFQEKDAIAQELAKLARAVAGKVKEPGAEPREVTWFPKENQLPHTAVYLPKDVLAQSYFANGFQASYKAGAKESKLVVIAMDGEDAARDGLKRYQETVGKSGKDVKTIAAPGNGGFAGKDSFYGNVAAVRSGSHIVVSLGAETDAAARRQVAETVRNIK